MVVAANNWVKVSVGFFPVFLPGYDDRPPTSSLRKMRRAYWVPLTKGAADGQQRGVTYTPGTAVQESHACQTHTS